VKSLSKKLRNAASEKGSLEDQLAKLQKEKQQSELYLEQKLSDAEANHRAELNDLAQENADKDHEISLLKSKIDSLGSQLHTAKKAVAKAVNAQPVPVPVVVQAPAPIAEKPKPVKAASNAALANQELAERNLELSKQLRAAGSKYDDVVGKVQALEKRNIELEIALEKEKNNLNAVALVHGETVAELNTTRAALHKKETRGEKSAREKLAHEVKSKDAEIASLGKTISSLEKNLKELTAQNLDASRANEKQSATIVQLKAAVQDGENQIDSLKFDLSQAEQEIQAKPVVTPEDLLPPAIWRYADFSPELNNSIARIGGGSLQPSSKLHSAFAAISKFFASEISSRDFALDQAYSENQAIRQAVNEFLVSLSIALALDPITFADFFAKSAGPGLVKVVGDLKSKSEDLKRKSDQLEAVVAHFHNELELKTDGSPSSAIENVKVIKEKLTAQTTTIARKSRKIRELNANLKATTDKAQADAADAQDQIAQLTQQLCCTKKGLNAATATNEGLKDKLSRLTAAFDDYQISHEQSSRESDEKHASQIQAAKQAKSQLEAQLREEIRQQQRLYEETADALSEASQSNDLLKKTVRAQRTTIAEKDALLAQTKQDSENRESELVARATDEKTHLIQAYEQATAELRDQCEAHRSDVEKLAGEVAESAKKLKKSQAAILDLKRGKLHAENELKAAEEQADREKQLAQVSAQLAIQTAESNCATKLADQKATCEKEKRRIIAYVADAFKHFFNPQDAIDERALRQVVNKARDELAALSATNAAVRRIVGAGARQTTDDAVAQAFLEKA
jgi:chromosome segregation ATPase